MGSLRLRHLPFPHLLVLLLVVICFVGIGNVNDDVVSRLLTNVIPSPDIIITSI
jgi:hypothetical protein